MHREYKVTNLTTMKTFIHLFKAYKVLREAGLESNGLDIVLSFCKQLNPNATRFNSQLVCRFFDNVGVITNKDGAELFKCLYATGILERIN